LLANSFCAYLPEEQQQQQHLGISNCCSDTKVSFGNWQSGTKVDGQSRGKAGVENMPSPLSVHFCEGVCPCLPKGVGGCGDFGRGKSSCVARQ